MLLFCGFVQADPIYRTVTIAWDSSQSADVVGYRVHYGTQSGNYTSLLDVGGATTADIPNLIDGTTYYFAITAYTAAGEESVLSTEFVHTVNPGILLNLSARANVQSGDNVLIAGFIIGGSSRKTVVIRALGPSLADHGISNPLSDPVLELHDGSGAIIVANDNWRDGNPSALIAHNLAPAYDQESGIVINLAPGDYTVIVRGVGGATGVALTEVYDAGVASE